MKMIQFIKLTAFILLLLFSACTQYRGEKSIDALANRVIQLIEEKDKQALKDLQISKQEYIETVYPQSEEAKQPGALTGEDFWRIFIGMRQKYHLNNHLNIFSRYKDIKIIEIGQPKSSVELDTVTIHKKIPIKIEATAISDGKQYTDTFDSILGIVLEKDGHYRLIRMIED